MCGICGKLSPGGIDPREIRRMCDTLVHRGPDDEGFYLKNRIGLGSRRLSIIDLKRGRQPICNEDRSVWIVYNGEIYNYRSLKKELAEKGHVFKTNTDTEVIVHLYEDLAERCVEKLEGMFAFAIWDERAEKLFLVRDRLGQKPLFYSQDGDNFLFGSEAKAILAADGVKREIDLKAVHHYLSLRFIPHPRTMFREIKKLPPGHYLVRQNGRTKIQRYWDLSFGKKVNLREDEFIEGLRARLTDCVRAHLVSDVPIGAFLSGGMDSSTIVAVMGHLLPGSFKTFSIGVAEQDFNELPYARKVAERYGTDHVERIVKADIIGLLPEMIWHLDEPSDPIAACMFEAAKLAAQSVKVVLGGDGGDELFAGFDRYQGVGWVDYYNRMPSFVRERAIGPFLDRVPDSYKYKSWSQRLRWVHHLSAFNGGERYAEATSFFRFDHEQKKLLFAERVWKELEHVRSSEIIMKSFDRANARDAVDRMLYVDYMTRLPEHSLMLTDRMNMAHGLEARSPYLDHSLVEFLASVPSSMKIRGRTLKHALRRLAGDYLPKEIVQRKKQGFMFPVAKWFKNELAEFVKISLLESPLIKAGWFRRDRVLALIEEHRKNRVDHHVRLWMLLNLKIWYQLYIEQESAGSIHQAIGEDLERHSAVVGRSLNRAGEVTTE